MKKNNKTAWYALRRTLPIWKFEENLAELIKKVSEYQIDEVIVKVDTEEFNHGHPEVRWLKQYQKKLLSLKQELEEIGVVYSLNPWLTVGHADRGRNAKSVIKNFKPMVGHDGIKCNHCACPLSKGWRENLQKTWEIYAQTRPRVLWVEDDIRTFNHKPVEFSCFCSLHMKEFSKRVGKNVSRDELVQAILKPGIPHKWRKIFLDMQRDIIADTVGFIIKVVHEISPETSLGLMSSGPRNHTCEGRDWKWLCEAMDSDNTLYSRPALGNYWENNLRGLYFVDDSIKLTRYAMDDPDVVEQTELENFPYSKYSKSHTFSFLQLVVSFALGCDGAAMNLYDHLGTPISIDPGIGELIAAEKKYMSGLASKTDKSLRSRGVRILFSPKESYRKCLNRNDDYKSLIADGYQAVEMLMSNGIGTTYTKENVAVSIGQTLRTFTDDEILELVSSDKGLYLDAVAAGVLVERGFGKLIGLKSIEAPKIVFDGEIFAAEEFFNSKFGGADKKFMTVQQLLCESDCFEFSEVKIMRNAEIVSRFVNLDAKPCSPSLIAFENSSGGRVVTHLIDWTKAYGPGFNSPYRRQQLLGGMKWLARGTIPVYTAVDEYPLVMRNDFEHRTLLGLFNLTLDEWPDAKIYVSDLRKIKSVKVLSSSGNWLTSKKLIISRTESEVIFLWKDKLTYRRPLFVNIEWEN